MRNDPSDREEYQGYRAKDLVPQDDGEGSTTLSSYLMKGSSFTRSHLSKSASELGRYNGFSVAQAQGTSKGNPVIKLYVHTTVRAQFLTNKDFKKGN